MIRDWWMAHRFEIYVKLGLAALVLVIWLAFMITWKRKGLIAQLCRDLDACWCNGDNGELPDCVKCVRARKELHELGWRAPAPPIDWNSHLPVGDGGTVVVEPRCKCRTGEHYFGPYQFGGYWVCDNCGFKELVKK